MYTHADGDDADRGGVYNDRTADGHLNTNKDWWPQSLDLKALGIPTEEAYVAAYSGMTSTGLSVDEKNKLYDSLTRFISVGVQGLDVVLPDGMRYDDTAGFYLTSQLAMFMSRVLSF